MFPQVPETESTWLISERLEAATSVVGLKLAPPQLIQIEPGQGPYFSAILCWCKILNFLVLEDKFTFFRVCIRCLPKFLTCEVSPYFFISFHVFLLTWSFYTRREMNIFCLLKDFRVKCGLSVWEPIVYLVVKKVKYKFLLGSMRTLTDSDNLYWILSSKSWPHSTIANLQIFFLIRKTTNF